MPALLLLLSLLLLLLLLLLCCTGNNPAQQLPASPPSWGGAQRLFSWHTRPVVNSCAGNTLLLLFDDDGNISCSRWRARVRCVVQLLGRMHEP